MMIYKNQESNNYFSYLKRLIFINIIQYLTVGVEGLGNHQYDSDNNDTTQNIVVRKIFMTTIYIKFIILI